MFGKDSDLIRSGAMTWGKQGLAVAVVVLNGVTRFVCTRN